MAAQPATVEGDRVDRHLADIDAKVIELEAGSRAALSAQRGRTRAVDELARMVELDQYLRNAWMAPPPQLSKDEAVRFRSKLVARIVRVDARHLGRLKALLHEHGWFRISTFGKQADAHAWLLVQHADRDIEFQKHTLAVLERMVSEGETSPQNYAYLYDRVAVAEGRPQRYGTQGECSTGRWQPSPLESADRVDAHRAAVGLPPLAEYARQFEAACR